MPSSNFLSTPMGGSSTAKYDFGGVSELYLLPLTKLTSTTDVLDAFGTVTSITGMALASGVTFQEIGFVEYTAGYTDAFKLAGTKKYMDVTLSFTVDVAGAAANEQANQIILTRKHVALVKRKSGKWYLLGQTDGLIPTESSANSGLKKEDESSMTFVLNGGNKGFAAQVIMDEVALKAMLTRVV